MARPSVIVAATVALITGARAGRADPEVTPLTPPGKAITAARATAPITIDGALDEPIWRGATWTSDLVEKEPDFGAPPAHPTRLAIAFDDEALYVGARMYSAGPDDVDGGVTRRDDGTQAERIIVSFDPFRTHRVAYSFAVTAGGVRVDWLHTDDDEYARDYSWDPVWDAAVTRLPDGWSAEMRIPLGQLRYPRGAQDAWGVNFNRFIPHRQEDLFWIAVPKTVRAWSSWMGELRGLGLLRPAHHLELLPYVSTGLALIERPSGQLDRAAHATGNVGADLRLGLGPGLTLSATINPDFGQVEADPAVVNLTAYEVRFDERRPFFLEGSQIFASSPRSFFYSRRVGGLPALDLDHDELRQPSSARILGAAKLSGRLAPGTNVGALAAVTDDEPGSIVKDGVRHELAIAPRTAWGVARVEHELGGAGSTAGATITTVARDLADPLLAQQLARLAVTGGADVRLRSDDGTYEINGDVGGSAIAGTPGAITRLARDSAHYFQRPDQPHVHLDPGATSMRGWAADLGAFKRSGTWLLSSGFTAESPAFDSNDAGTLQSADDLDYFTEVTRHDTEPGDHLHAWRLTGHVSGGWNFGGVRKSGDVWLDGVITLPSFASFGATLTGHYPGLLDDTTRGGPLMRDGAGASAALYANSTPNRPTVIGASVKATWSETGERGVRALIDLTALPTQRLRLQLEPRVVLHRIAQQYVDTITDAGGGAGTYGARYLFASLWQREVAAQLRAQLALTPDLALDAYVEPFVSIGHYSGLGELAAARTSDLRTYDAIDRAGGTITVHDGGATFSTDDPDFTTVSLRSTVVLRWEIRPGSVLYAVWQQTRGHTDVLADPGAGVLGRPFTAAGEHVIALKLSWWFAP